jgi:hypothetical protein
LPLAAVKEERLLVLMCLFVLCVPGWGFIDAEWEIMPVIIVRGRRGDGRIGWGDGR